MEPLRAHPFEALVAAVLTIIGAVFLALGPDVAPSSTRALLPVWLVYAWAAGLAAGGGATAAGLLARQPYIERAGLGALAGVTAAYAAVLLVWVGPPAVLGAVTYAALAVACLVRIRALGVLLRHSGGR